LVVVAGSAALASASCGDAVRQGRSPAYLVIEELVAASGAEPDKFSHTLASDVVTNVKVDEYYQPTIYEDPGRVQMHIALKDAGIPGNPTTPSPNNLITVDRYHVSYTRADGRNTAGVDVPHAFDGAATGTIGSNASTMSFILVRAQAKKEAPLQALRGIGGAMLISTIAEVTFFGRDQAGNAVSVVGRISVNFADWGDPNK
jgi:hypothetical protein